MSLKPSGQVGVSSQVRKVIEAVCEQRFEGMMGRAVQREEIQLGAKFQNSSHLLRAQFRAELAHDAINQG